MASLMCFNLGSLMKIARRFPAKVLLVGEYTVLDGSAFLTLPLSSMSMEWQLGDFSAVSSSLDGFFGFLRRCQFDRIDLLRFERELAEGWYLSSTIVQGYGLGSSGAVCAAVYHRYALDSCSDPGTLRQVFAQMESYFHGSSSGLDPLVSYLQRIVCSIDGELMIRGEEMFGDLGLFLLDSNMPRKTDLLVELYRREIRQKARPLAKLVNGFVKAFLDHNSPAVREHFRRISELQFDLFQAMIPPHIQALWLEGLNSDDYYIKLCGAGGGGYFLGLKNKCLPQSEDGLKVILL